MDHRVLQSRLLRHLALAAALIAAPFAVGAQVKLDISVPWGPGEFHSLNAARFAERVKEVTKGEVVMATHPGGTLGVKANESLRSIGEGVVPMGEYALFQNASRGASLAVETLPFLVKDYDELGILHKSFRPVWDKVLEKNNQKALYVVPWPNQFFFVKRPIATIDDFKGLKMRSLDRLTTDWINRLGMTPVQVTNLEILQALGSGMVDGVPTSAGTAVAQKYWDFMKFGYQTNHIWASNVMAINLDTWKKLEPRHQTAIEGAARELEPQFWEASKQDHAKKVAELQANGMDIKPASRAMLEEMVKRTTSLWDQYAKPMGPEALQALADYRKAVGR
jgi:TRAP-type C4-dicarboxylate transport system substrate-binding protein